MSVLSQGGSWRTPRDLAHVSFLRAPDEATVACGLRLVLAADRPMGRLMMLRLAAREIERRADAQPAWKKGTIVFAGPTPRE